MSNKNELSTATSPYLLQHADNPVHWVEWSEEAFQKAADENKLVLVSIGYSACHWCHVMEHESFEDEAVANLMNEHFICIKVDREERPDVDQVYMNAVQLMTQQGGWPLNCFTLPDGKPIYGGTYFPKEKWTQVLSNLWETYVQQPEKVREYGKKLSEGVQLSEMIDVHDNKLDFNPSIIDQLVQKWKRNFDFDEGGENRAPKFPLPNNYEFLLQYGVINKDQTVINHVLKSLVKMAQGGIYDQLKGGFARYSVYKGWKVPHFEKMLYDNGQLLSLYCEAYKYSSNPEFKRVILQSVTWLQDEMKDKTNGGYYAALDADSEGVEGKFYTWTKDELKNILEEDFDWFKDYYNINEKGYWEEGRYILLRRTDDETFAAQCNIKPTDFNTRLSKVHSKLLKIREKRIAPGLDDKKITSWNALLLKGLIDAGTTLNKQDLINDGIELGNWIIDNIWDEKNEKLLRIAPKNEKRVYGFLDDYAHTIEAFIHIYEKTFNQRFLDFAKSLAHRTIELFGDEKTQLFYYVEESTELLARKMEINDNVIPASNSVMGKNLFRLSIFFNKPEYAERSRKMLSAVYEQMPQYGSGYSNWAQLALFFNQSFKELAIVGDDALEEGKRFWSEYTPNTLYAISKKANIPFLKGREKLNETLFYICKDQHCNAPLKSFEETLPLILIN